MKRVHLSKVLEATGIDTKTAATELFPDNSYPIKAIIRIMDGKAQLNEDQISKLSTLTGIPINLLFERTFPIEVKDGSDDMHISFGEFRALVNVSTLEVKVFDNNSIVHDTFKTTPGLDIRELLTQIQLRIEKHKKNEQ